MESSNRAISKYGYVEGAGWKRVVRVARLEREQAKQRNHNRRRSRRRKNQYDQITGLPQRHLSARVCIMAQRRSVPHLLAGPPDKGKHHSHDDDASNSSATSLPGLTVRLSWAQSKAVCMERGRRGGQPGWRLGLCRWTKEGGA